MFYQPYLSKFYVLPTQCVYEFCVDLRTNSDISVYSINWKVFIIETECVYCAVSSCIYTIKVKVFNPYRTNVENRVSS